MICSKVYVAWRELDLATSAEETFLKKDLPNNVLKICLSEFTYTKM